jgi:Spy/CpxP family protein refolding chaperone
MNTLHLLLAACLCAVFAASAVAQPAAAVAQPPAGSGATEPGVSVGELQRMFDAYALMQAQEQLKISDDQFSQFLTRFKALQDVRRKALGQRTRAIMELRNLTKEPQPDENQLKDRLKALQELEAQAAADTKKAYEAVDQVLDVRQQARFRVFEENMERRQLELISRARQANRLKKQQQ